MAVSKNQRTGEKQFHFCSGPCVDCGATDPRGNGDYTPHAEMVEKASAGDAKAKSELMTYNQGFVPVRRAAIKGKTKMVRLCQQCAVRA